MNAARLWMVGSVVAVVALLLGTWFVGVAPRLEEATKANSDRQMVEAQNAIQQVNLTSLKKQFENIEELRDKLAEVRTSIPAELALDDLVGELNALAEQSGVVVSSLGLTDPFAFAPVEDPNADAEITAALGSVSPEAFFAVPVQLTVTGEYAASLTFVSLLQSAERFFLLSDLTLANGTMVDGSVVELSLSGHVFVLLDASSVTAPPVPTVPAPAPNGTPAPTETAPTS